MTSLDNLFQCLTLFKVKKVFLIVRLNTSCFSYSSCFPMYCCKENGLPEERLPCSPWRRLWRCRLSLCSTKTTTVEQISTLQLKEHPVLQQVETPCTTRLLAGTESCAEEPTQQQVFWHELWPMGDLHLNSLFLEDCSPWEERAA